MRVLAVWSEAPGWTEALVDDPGDPGDPWSQWGVLVCYVSAAGPTVSMCECEPYGGSDWCGHRAAVLALVMTEATA